MGGRPSPPHHLGSQRILAPAAGHVARPAVGPTGESVYRFSRPGGKGELDFQGVFARAYQRKDFCSASRLSPSHNVARQEITSPRFWQDSPSNVSELQRLYQWFLRAGWSKTNGLPPLLPRIS